LESESLTKLVENDCGTDGNEGRSELSSIQWSDTRPSESESLTMLVENDCETDGNEGRNGLDPCYGDRFVETSFFREKNRGFSMM